MIFDIIVEDKMTALSIIIPEDLAEQSSSIAKELHISRSGFIRLAIENEIKAYRLKEEKNAMLIGIKAIKNNTDYQNESRELEHLDEPLKDEGSDWWKK